MAPHPKKNVTTCVVGGGSSAHVLIPLLSEMGHTVNLYTRRPDEWKDDVSCEITNGVTGQVSTTYHGTIHRKSNNAADVIPTADVIILCLPVYVYRPVLDQIAPFVSQTKKEVFVGTIFGQAGFDWMVSSSIIRQEEEEEEPRSNIVTFAIGSIPWICRTRTYGERGINYGPKDVNVVAVTPPGRFDKLNDIFLKDISSRTMGKVKFELADSFLDLTLSVDNQIIHPARCYGLWKKSGGTGVWDSLAAVPFFYRDFDQESADILQRLDAEYERIRQAIRSKLPQKKFKYMLGYLELEKLNHKSSHVGILASLKESVQLASIKTPTVEGPDGKRHLDINFRFFKDDIPYGLLIAKALAEMLEVKTPFLDEVIVWAQTLRGECFLNKEGKINLKYCMSQEYLCGIPQVYGLHTIEALDN
ncbi:NAD/NADP octopine/nopaline dehydrogenase, alpha-helical domain [Seminavis robusta]|uniref:NAD/NADP octopine/nopaline dehydrogenase, alpha-helical domain n=1 Tax=Seminavis robusta TaxID=568900 RepID=A0A9N8DLS3_9STRA|nr:NAD/NADP octopine/nopaline dehydrogenase, alpha-helical domain [Seminavis robusta]|eukprot:Sro202_g085410.1 NAD/NADP octopine/nopaline dehydrogenase, alpha-helical domain (417) ;mRNA; r:45695-47027